MYYITQEATYLWINPINYPVLHATLHTSCYLLRKKSFEKITNRAWYTTTEKVPDVIDCDRQIFTRDGQQLNLIDTTAKVVSF